jgi:hypothetical protein
VGVGIGGWDSIRRIKAEVGVVVDEITRGGINWRLHADLERRDRKSKTVREAFSQYLSRKGAEKRLAVRFYTLLKDPTAD